MLLRNQCILACGHIFQDPVGDPEIPANHLFLGTGLWFGQRLGLLVLHRGARPDLLGFLGVATIPEMVFPSHLTSFGLLLIVPHLTA